MSNIILVNRGQVNCLVAEHDIGNIEIAALACTCVDQQSKWLVRGCQSRITSKKHIKLYSDGHA